MKKKFNFNKRALDALPKPTGKQRSYVYDAKVHGLSFAVTPTGKKWFVLYRKIQGRPERITLGRYPDLSIEQARAAAHRMNAAIAVGENPAEQRRALGRRCTLRELWEQYLTRHLRVHTKRWQDAEAIFRRSLAHWSTRPAVEIRAADVAALHTRMGTAHGPYSANRTVELLCAIYNAAARWGYEGQNPVRGVTPFKEQSRERYLLASEFPAFFEALDAEEDDTARDFFMVCLLTGARSGNVKAMRWDQLELSGGVWNIPDTKSGMPQRVILVLPVIALLEKRPTDSPWVFPAKRGRTGHLMNFKAAWKRVKVRAGIQGLRLHDLRRTLGSFQAATGASLPIIAKSLGHTSLSSTQIYARLDLAPVRKAVEKATLAMLEAANKK